MAIGPKTTLVLSRSTEVDDGMGGFTFTWTNVRDVIGTFSTLTERERMMYGKKAAAASHKFVVDYQFSSDILLTDRFIYGSHIDEIIGTENPMNQNRFVIFFLEEAVNG